MPFIAVAAFIILLSLLFFLTGLLAKRKKLKAADLYGQEKFGIDLPRTAIVTQKKPYLPSLNQCTDAEAFFLLIVPYIGSLTLEKRSLLRTELERLKSSLAMNKQIYGDFMDEYDLYDGLNDEEAGQKWRKLSQRKINEAA